jgi:hypothetical protein
MARRIFMMVVVTITFAVITALIIYSSSGVDNVQKTSQGLLNAILAVLEIVVIIIILIILHDYLRSRRPHRLLFEGVSNQGQLASAENAPTDLNTLAKEERIHQFLVIYYELQSFIEEAERQRRIESDRSQEGPADRTIRSSPFLSDELNFADVPDTQNLARFFPSLHRGSHDPHDLTLTTIKFLKQNLEQVMGDTQVPFQESASQRTTDKALTSTHSQISSVTLQQIVSSVPDKMKPVINLIDILIPPRLTKATAYLQRRRDPLSPQRDAGITLDVSLPDGSTNSMVRTLWQPIPANDNGSSSQGFPKSAEGQLTGVYVDLLKPAMRLLVLLFWEQKLISALNKRKPEKGDQMNRQEYNAYFIFLLGALYAVSSLQFKQQQAFFARLALERFRRAAELHADWETPHRYIGDIYDKLAKHSKDEAARYKDEVARCERFIKSGVEAYDKYYKLAGEQVDKKRKQADAYLKKALLLLRSSKDEDLDKSVDLFHEALQQVDDFLIYEDYPQLFDVYLYNVASWFARVKGKDASARKHIEHKLQKCDGFEHCTLQEEARRYLVYSMARSQFVWFAVADDEDLRPIIDKPAVERLKSELTRIQNDEAKFSSNYRLAYQKGEEFKDRIDEILEKVWPG